MRRRKALSYILSVVIMTLVTSALATSVLYWGLTQVGESRTTLSASQKARIERAQQRLVIEDVQRLNSTSLRIYVRNVGAVQIVVDQVYVNHTAASSLSPTKLSLASQALGSINATFTGFTFTQDSVQLVKVTTTRGVYDVGSWTL